MIFKKKWLFSVRYFGQLDKIGIKIGEVVMLLETEKIEALAEKLNVSKDEMMRESLKYYLEKKLREIKLEIFKIRDRYKISSVKEFEKLYQEGKIEEEDSWQDLQNLDHLEFKKNELEKELKLL